MVIHAGLGLEHGRPAGAVHQHELPRRRRHIHDRRGGRVPLRHRADTDPRLGGDAPPIPADAQAGQIERRRPERSANTLLVYHPAARHVARHHHVWQPDVVYRPVRQRHGDDPAAVAAARQLRHQDGAAARQRADGLEDLGVGPDDIPAPTGAIH